MHLVLGIFVCIIFLFLFFVIGHIITKQLKINEENQLLGCLVNIALGASTFLIIINLISTLFKDFNLGLLITFVIIVFIMFWQLKELPQLLNKQRLFDFIKQTNDKYSWILLGVTNLIYGITTFSTTKIDHYGLGNAHIFNVNQLIAGTYPPKYSCLPNLSQKFHYGADIFGAIVSKFSGCHPENAIDILTLVFLNLSFLVLYALAIKFANSNSINKYLIPFAALFAWGPITSLFTKGKDEILPRNFLEKIVYLTQSRLIDSATWSGLTLHWFFDPPIGISVFFFLTILYFLYRFFSEEERNLKFSILLGLFLSSLIIIDHSKLILVFGGIFVYIFLFCHVPLIEEINTGEKKKFFNLLQYIGIMVLIVAVVSFGHSNPIKLFDLVSADLYKELGPFRNNIFLLLIYSFGFFQAYKAKQKWNSFLIPFFAVSFIAPLFLTIQGEELGKITMFGNLIGAFSIPYALEFVVHKLNIKEKKSVIFYILVTLVFSFSSIMFWAFGDKIKPLFKIEGAKLKYTGLQDLPIPKNKEEVNLIKYLKSQNTKDNTILADTYYADLFSTNTGLFTLVLDSAFNKLVDKTVIEQYFNDYRGNYYPLSYSFNGKILQEHKVRWLNISPRFFKFIMNPQARVRLLNAFLNKKVYPSFSIKDIEVYKIEPGSLVTKPSNDYADLLKKFLRSSKKTNSSYYLRQIALCPYLAIYSAMSNDFDGDKIADIAFFDEMNKKWNIIYGKNQKEEEIDLKKSILSDYLEDGLFIPIPSDYDGDSKTDIALFNRVTGMWNVIPTSSPQSKPIGPFRMKVQFSGRVLGKPEPLFVTGRKDAGDLVYIEYLKDNKIIFGFDHWGAGGPVSKPIKIDPKSFYNLEISIGNLYSSANVDKNLLEKLIIKLDGKEVFRAKSNFYPTRDEEITIGRNEIGGTTCGPSFSGTIKDIERVNLFEGRNWLWGGAIGEIPLPCDLDGDSKTDVSAYTAENFTRWPTLLSSTNYGFIDNSFDVSSLDIPMYGDIDGDKKDDYVIYKVNENSFYAYLSTKVYDKSSPIKVKMGDATSRLVLADYDGDSKVDLAVWSPETGMWEIAYIKDLLTNSNTGATQPFIGCGSFSGAINTTPCVTHTFMLGNPGDIPMPGDYNGDGKTEIAVLHFDTYEFEIGTSNGTSKKIDLSKYKGLTPANFIGI